MFVDVFFCVFMLLVDILVVIVCFQYAVDIVVGLRSVAVTVFCQGVLIKAAFVFVEKVVIDVVVPDERVFAVFACEPDGIHHMPRSGVIGCQYEFDALFRGGDVGGEVVVQVFEVGDAGMHVAFRAEIVRQPYAPNEDSASGSKCDST